MVSVNTANSMANITDVVPRKPGRPKGLPKPPTSGRKRGTRNRVTREIAEIAQKHGKAIVAGLMKEFKATDDLDVKVKIASLVLSYGFGQPTRRSEVSGPDGGAIQQQTQIIEASQRVAAAMAEVAHEEDPAEAMGDEALGATQAINFVLAQREAAQRRGAPVAPTPAPAPDVAVEAPQPAQESVEEPEEPAGDPEPPPEGCTVAFITSDLSITALPPARPGLPLTYELKSRGRLMRRAAWEVVLELARKQVGADLGPFVATGPQPQAGTVAPQVAVSGRIL